MPNPLVEAQAFLVADAANQPAGTTHSTSFPSAAITHPHVQFAWDGSPTYADNREDAAVRFTVWTEFGKVTDAQDIAEGILARLIPWSSSDVQRVDRGAGRLPGIDPDTALPFCSFTVSFVMRAMGAS